ncbi:hypothetical protein M758_12G042000 [Ceratodon purpureus]|nr:hypothetical protein M758_12G042000 [Ceratodon purpureus]
MASWAGILHWESSNQGPAQSRSRGSASRLQTKPGARRRCYSPDAEMRILTACGLRAATPVGVHALQAPLPPRRSLAVPLLNRQGRHSSAAMGRSITSKLRGAVELQLTISLGGLRPLGWVIGGGLCLRASSAPSCGPSHASWVGSGRM